MRRITHLPELDAYGRSIACIPLEPLQVTVRTVSPVSSNDPVALDGVLAYAMVMEAMRGKPFPQSGGPFWQPLPLKLDRLVNDLPLWTSTDFLPFDVHKRLTHIHRRTADNPYAMIGLMQTIHAKRPRRFPSSAAGPYMDYRVPDRRYVADKWVATCVGNLAEVQRLLSMVQYFGKGSKRGCGFIDEWQVEPIERFSWRDAEGFALRPIPTDESDTGVGVRQGFTPPYWLRDTWVMCEPSIAGQML